jgi:Dioxygenases related to 2-nitropropane dioxygenase
MLYSAAILRSLSIVKIDLKINLPCSVLMVARIGKPRKSRDTVLTNMMKSFFIGEKEIRLPIIQGGMGVGISLSGLASAVANEGGVGVISCAGLGLLYKQTASDYLRDCIWGLKEELRKTREKTKGIVGVNIMVALSNFADMVRTAITEKADIIFSGAGLPLNLPSYLTPDSKTLLVPIVSSARAAQIICEKWHTNYNYLPDAIVVEGPKAGGHLGFKKNEIDDENYSLEHLIPEVLAVTNQYSEKKNIPVIAAGGISTGEDILRFIQLGATGVQLASIFVPTDECDASPVFKQVYISSSKKDALIIQSPVGMPGRAFDGQFIRSVNEGNEKPRSCPFHCIKTCDYSKSPYCIIKALYNAAKGKMDKGYAFAGANAYLANKISSVKEVIAKLKNEFDTASK